MQQNVKTCMTTAKRPKLAPTRIDNMASQYIVWLRETFIPELSITDHVGTRRVQIPNPAEKKEKNQFSPRPGKRPIEKSLQEKKWGGLHLKK